MDQTPDFTGYDWKTRVNEKIEVGLGGVAICISFFFVRGCLNGWNLKMPHVKKENIYKATFC